MADQDKGLLLSEAIRLGAMLGPQVFGRLRDRNGGTCAMGAALQSVGLTGLDDELAIDLLQQRFPILERPATCPCRCDWKGPSPVVGDVVAHMNDDHRFCRERIADWVQTQEASGSIAPPAIAEVDPVAHG